MGRSFLAAPPTDHPSESGTCHHRGVSLFGYSAEIVADFPDIRSAVIHLVGLSNGPTPPDLADLYRVEQTRVRDSLSDKRLSELPSVAAWRRAFSSFGVKPTQYRSAVEALLRRLTKSGDIPGINLAVDIANLVSIRHRLPVAVFDQAEVTGDTKVRYAAGTERFTDLGGDMVTHPEIGEVIFVDRDDLVSARRWCWRQSDQSAARDQTEEIVVTVEGQHDGAEADVSRALDDLLMLFDEYQPEATTSSALLSPSRPEGP